MLEGMTFLGVELADDFEVPSGQKLFLYWLHPQCCNAYTFVLTDYAFEPPDDDYWGGQMTAHEARDFSLL